MSDRLHVAMIDDDAAVLDALRYYLARQTIRTSTFQAAEDGKIREGSFNLGAVSEVRNKIAKACDWDNAPVDEPVGSIEPNGR